MEYKGSARGFVWGRSAGWSLDGGSRAYWRGRRPYGATSAREQTGRRDRQERDQQGSPFESAVPREMDGRGLDRYLRT